MATNTEHFKNLLTKEAENLETQLASLGRKNPDRPGDWETTRKESGTEDADELDVSEQIETYENNNAVLSQLEIQLKNVKEALAKIEDGTYGKCSVCSNDIEEDRLEADPSATTCKTHM
ncbi:MAG: TraR/DksA family transcriptional regulator [Parcubacteria bacterium C7867-003]|nr:MAG: TraR/DksA family transcriptional regulator [Parcubacteria bacterium C7867-003]